jgi:hypothetical protein
MELKEGIKSQCSLSRRVSRSQAILRSRDSANTKDILKNDTNCGVPQSRIFREETLRRKRISSLLYFLLTYTPSYLPLVGVLTDQSRCSAKWLVRTPTTGNCIISTPKLPPSGRSVRYDPTSVPQRPLERPSYS